MLKNHEDLRARSQPSHARRGMLERMIRHACLAAAITIAGCNTSIYVRDGVTDGDTFYLAPQALTDDDAVLQSWVTYSLMRSACKLRIGGDNPARVSTYECELTARRHLADAWIDKRERGGPREDAYLDALAAVRQAGFLAEYVAHYFGRAGWQVPDGLETDAFDAWRRAHLAGHDPETRLIGSWGYARLVAR